MENAVSRVTNRRKPSSYPELGSHSTRTRSSTPMIRGPVARLTRSEMSAQSMRTWRPSKETVPSEERTETGTGGPGNR